MPFINTTLAPLVQDEDSTGRWTGTLQDETDTAVASASINTAVITLYDELTGRIINSRDAQDINGANNVTIHATSGLFTWTIQPADNLIIDERLAVERHVALIEVTHNTSKKQKIAISLKVRNLRTV